MTQNADTEILVCLHCRRQSTSTNSDDDFHEIFDEVGLELQLDKLLEKYFHLEVRAENVRGLQVLCDDCMNQLIELFDVDESAKEKQQQQHNNGTEVVDDAGEEQKFDDICKDSCEMILNGIQSSEVVVEEDTEIHSVEIKKNFSDNEEDTNENVEKIESDLYAGELFDTSENLRIEEADELAATEVLCCNDYDVVDVEAYLDSVINSKLENLDFHWNSKCRICLSYFNTFQELLQHTLINHKHDNILHCMLNECDEVFHNVKLIARHLILKHYDLKCLQIYGNCPDCDLRFSNFIHFNKHSCYRTLKRRAGMRNYCIKCQMEFSSFKRYVFHLQFHLAKRRPKICLICERFFASIDEFFEHVQYEHEPEETWACITCDRVFKDKNVYDSHSRNHQLKYKYECNYCTKTYDHKHLLMTHIDTCHETIEFRCDICGKVLANAANHHKHMKSHVSEIEVQVYLCVHCGLIARDKEDILEHIECEESKCLKSSIQHEILNKAYTCEYCSLNYKDIADLKAHRATAAHADNMYECPLCKEKYTEYKRMRNHTKSHMTYESWLIGFPINRFYVCTMTNCEKTYAQWSAMYHHKRRFHKQLLCALCNQIFFNQAQLESHKNTCKKLLEYKCQFCSKDCSSKMSLSVHVARSHNNKYLVCSTCKASYKDKEALQKHIDFMHVPMQCSQCDKVIKNKRNLQTHERVVHKNEQRYFCRVCNKGYYNKNEMLTHEKNVHTDILYNCSECEFSTNYAKSLEVHMAMHRKELQYKCPICAKEFGRKNVLNLHIRRHDSNRLFVCSQRIVNGCKASFVTNYLLNKHIKEKHSKLKANSNTESKAKRLRSANMLTQLEDDDNDRNDAEEDVDNPETLVMSECIENTMDANCINFVLDDEENMQNEDCIIEIIEENMSCE